MANILLADLKAEIEANVRSSLNEDLGSGDITAQLIERTQRAQARIISRDAAVLCGTAWVDEVFHRIDPSVSLLWQARDGQQVPAGGLLLQLEGPARALLSGERSALNFLQTLSAVSTACRTTASAFTTLF
jgi:nicotinate-nucleotide pyrophosphorylase (carboxylating)